jgi:hypothetical protein
VAVAVGAGVSVTVGWGEALGDAGVEVAEIGRHPAPTTLASNVETKAVRTPDKNVKRSRFLIIIGPSG